VKIPTLFFDILFYAIDIPIAKPIIHIMSGQPPTLGGAKKKATVKRKRSASSASKKARVAPKKKPAKKEATKKATKKKPATKKAKGAGPTLAQLQKEAKRLKITLSKDGKKKDKAALKRAISRK
jgi:hypothetical protein